MVLRQAPIITLMLIAGVVDVQAAVYYVDPSGSDGGPGTEAQPWLSIQHAADTVSAGDTVRVKAGTYDERVQVTRSGTSGNKIVFISDTRRQAAVEHGFRLEADHIRIEGFDITHDAGGWQDGGIWLAGDNVDIVDNYIHDVPGQGISPSWSGKGAWDDIYVADNHVYRCNKGIIIDGRNWLVENNEIERLVRPSSGGEDADHMRFFGQNITIRNNYMHGTRESEIGSSHVDMFQTYHNNGNEAKNILIEGNMAVGFSHEILMAEGYDDRFDGITFRNNVFAGASSWVMNVYSIQNMTIINNTFHGFYHGVAFRARKAGSMDSFGGIIKNNIFTGGISSYWASGDSEYESGHNLIYDVRDAPDPGDPSDIMGQDPLFVNPSDIVGPDGIPFTDDDGLRLQAGSPALGAAEGGGDIGAYGKAPSVNGIFSDRFEIAPYPDLRGLRTAKERLNNAARMN